MTEFFLNDLLVYVDYTAITAQEKPRGYEIFIDKVLLCKGPKVLDIKEVLPDDELKAIEEHCFSEHCNDRD